MKDNPLSDDQKQELDAALERGTAFEELVRAKGWEFVKNYVASKIQSFANKAITEGFKNQEDYQYERGQVQGLRTLLGHIESAIRTLEDKRKENKEVPKE